eukprot:1160421-Amphidinium_carterae.1
MEQTMLATSACHATSCAAMVRFSFWGSHVERDATTAKIDYSQWLVTYTELLPHCNTKYMHEVNSMKFWFQAPIDCGPHPMLLSFKLAESALEAQTYDRYL